MAYIEKKTIKGKVYYYLTETKRLHGKFKKTRKYLGTKIPKDLLHLEQRKKIIRKKITKKETATIDQIKKNFLKTHKINKSLWKTEKERIIEFIYNTNAIEGNTLTLDETADVLEGKKIKGKKRDVREAKNMKKCIDFLFEHKGDIDEKMILKLHYIEMQGVMPDAGKFRKVNVRVGNYICPIWEEVPGLMSEFISWYNDEKKQLHPFELAALVHLKFVKIHPFRDGNGRMTRLLMNFVLLKSKNPLLNIFNDKKTIYYLVLQRFDMDGKERTFIRYLFEVYGRQYLEYLK
jgi:Fic family protein